MFQKFRIIAILVSLVTVTSCSYTFYSSGCNYPQARILNKQAVISDTLSETSGLACQDSVFVSFNDSGGKPVLYTFGTDGKLRIHSEILDGENTDWETIGSDINNYYIGDVGNNFGNRDTLIIYKVPVLQDPSELNVAVSPEIITFSYGEETSFNKTGWYSHDCEAMFWYRDSLYLFSKDWVNMQARIYVIPAKPGHYNLTARATYDADVLITGADIDPVGHEVVLVGYRNYIPVMIRYCFENDPAIISCGGKARKFLFHAGAQVEAVCYDPAGRIWVTAEKYISKQALYQAY